MPVMAKTRAVIRSLEPLLTVPRAPRANARDANAAAAAMGIAHAESSSVAFETVRVSSIASGIATTATIPLSRASVARGLDPLGCA